MLTLRKSLLNGRIRVFLVCANDRLTSIIHDFLELEDKIEVVGEKKTAKDALNRFEVMVPDVIVLEMGWDFLSGLESLSLFRKYLPAAKVIVLSFSAEDGYRAAFLKAGAHDFISETDIVNGLLPAILSTQNESE